MASTDANPIPIKNTAYRVSFPILDADGDLVTGATGLDSEVSKDGGTFTDCTAEATEIATASGMYFLDLTATEMNADTVAIIVKTTSSGAKTTPMILYPNKAGGLAVNVTAWAGSATATGNIAIKNTLAHGTDITGTPADSAGVTTLLTRVSSTIFTGITSLKEWLGLMAGKQTGNATARTEVRSTGAGSGTFDETTDSQEAVRDRGDAAWLGGATPAQVQTELVTYGALRPTTAARTLDVTATGEAGIDWSNIGAPTTAQNLSGTTISTSQAIASVSGSVGSVTGAVGSVTGAVGSVTSPVTLTAAYDAAKTAASQTSVNIIDDFVDTEVAAIKVVTDKLDTALVVDGAVYQYTANALELAPAGGGGGDASQATLLAVKAKTDALPSDPADASDIAASFTVTNAKVDAVATKTNNLPPDPADASDVAASFATVNTKLDAISTGLPLDTTELNAIADALLKRDWTAVTGEAAYSALNAFRMLRNVWSTSTGDLVVKKEDGATTAWQRTLSTDPNADPIIGAT